MDVEGSDFPAALPVLWPRESRRSTTLKENLTSLCVLHAAPVLLFFAVLAALQQHHPVQHVSAAAV